MIAILVPLGGCTFPDVGYRESPAGAGGQGGAAGPASTSASGGMSSGGGFATSQVITGNTTTASTTTGPCYLPQTCADDAHKCATAAINKYTACTQPCKSKPDCIAPCASTEQATLATCSAGCKACAPAGCDGAVASCVLIVGQ